MDPLLILIQIKGWLTGAKAKVTSLPDGLIAVADPGFLPGWGAISPGGANI